MSAPTASRIKLLIVLLMGCAIGCVAVLSFKPGSRISLLHMYWSQARIDSEDTMAALAAARKDPPLLLPKGQYATTDRIDLGDRSLKSRFELSLTDAGTFAAARTTTIGRDRDDRVAVQGRYSVVGRVIEFVPEDGPVGLYPVDGTSLASLKDDGSLALTAGDHSIVLHRVPTP